MKDSTTFAVLGAGNGGHAMSADLMLAGFKVNLFELERFKENIEPVKEKGGIYLSGAARKGFARINKVTTDIEEAVEGVDVICITVPAYGHMAFFEVLTRYLEDGQVIVIWPDNWGSIRLHKYMKTMKIHINVTISGTSSLIYATRRVGPAHVWVRRVKELLPVSALPGKKTEKVVEILKRVYPQVVGARSIMEVNFNNPNFTSHPPVMILSASRIEATKGDFDIYKEGFNQTSVKKVAAALEQERLKVCEAFGTKGDWAQSFYASPRSAFRSYGKAVREKLPFVRQATPDMAPDTLKFRYLSEDVPYGLVPIASLGSLAGVETPVTKAIIVLASIINDTNYWQEGLTVEKLGFAGLSPREISGLLR